MSQPSFNWAATVSGCYMISSFFNGSTFNVLIVFMAGVVTFFASCLLPLVPTYLAYLSGVSLAATGENGQHRGLLVRVASVFVIGFICSFVTLSLAFNSLAFFLAPHRELINRLAGVLFLVMGFALIGMLDHSPLGKERKLDVRHLFNQQKYLHSFLTGIAFGFGWTPCIGPILAIILFTANQQATAVTGSLLLVVYGLGLGLPFLLVAVAFDQIMPFLKKSQRFSRWLMILSGVLIIVIGLLMLSGQFARVSIELLKLGNLRTLAV